MDVSDSFDDDDLISRLESNDPTLTDLDLTLIKTPNNPRFLNALASNTQLKRVFEIGLREDIIFLPIIAQHKTIETVETTDAEWEETEATKWFTVMLRQMPNLRNLSLYYFEFDADFVNALEENTTLDSLNIESTDLTSDEYARIVNTLLINTTLTRFSVILESPSLENVQVLVNVMQKNSTLTHLGLVVMIHDFLQLLKPLSQHRTLKHLDIQMMGAIQQLKLVKQIDVERILQDTTLTSLKLSDVSQSILVGISRGLKSNAFLKHLIINNFVESASETVFLALRDILRLNLTQISIPSLHLPSYLSTVHNVRMIADVIEQNTAIEHLKLMLFFAPDLPEAYSILAAGLVRNGSLLHINVPLVQTDFIVERNKRAHESARQAAIAVLHMKPTLALNKDMKRILAREIYASRWNNQWWTEEERRQAGIFSSEKRTRINACIACKVEPARYKSAADSSKTYCGSYCQFIQHYNLPDVRGMTPKQAVHALSQA